MYDIFVDIQNSYHLLINNFLRCLFSISFLTIRSLGCCLFYRTLKRTHLLCCYHSESDVVLTVLDVKESPGGVAVGCYTRRVTDRA